MALKFDMSGSNWKDDYLRQMNQKSMGEDIGEALGYGAGYLREHKGKMGKAYQNYLVTVPEGELPKDINEFASGYRRTQKAKKRFKKFGEKAGLTERFEKIKEGVTGRDDDKYSEYFNLFGEDVEDPLTRWMESDEAEGMVKEYKIGQKDIRKTERKERRDIRKAERKAGFQELGSDIKSAYGGIESGIKSGISDVGELGTKVKGAVSDFYTGGPAGGKEKGLLGMVQRFLPGGQTGFNPTPTLMENYPGQQYGQEFQASPFSIGTGRTDFGVNPTYQNQGGESWRDYTSSLVLNPPRIPQNEVQYEGPYNPDYNNESPLKNPNLNFVRGY